MSDVTLGFRFCPQCAQGLAWIEAEEDGGAKSRLRCAACGFTHWNNPTPVLAAVVECTDRDGRLLLARNAAWSGRMFALITGFMEAGETPEAGIAREVLEETALVADAVSLIGVYDFQRMNQVIITYHVQARGEIRLSPELAEYRLFAPGDVLCWPAGTGHALADWLRGRGIEPRYIEWPPRSEPAAS
jgi:NAD+ diphosphatase